MDRRSFVAGAAAGAVLGTGTVFAAAGRQNQAPDSANGSVQSSRGDTREWKMVLAWPKNFPGIGTGSQRLADRITAMSDGRINIKIYGGGELVPPFESFDAVREGKVQCAHATPYYWMNKNRCIAFFGGVPAGLTAMEHNAWILSGGGQALWDEVYGELGVKGFLAGNTAVQMFGWFRNEINSLEDLRGIRMRIPGIAGEVLNRIGVTTVNLPGAEVMPALQSGVIDAAEWIGPYNDLAFGFHQVAPYYYGPGFHEGGTAVEFIVNRALWDSLPADLQQIVSAACLTENTLIHSEMVARNMGALKALVEEHGVQLRNLPDDVTSELNRLAEEVLAETAEDNAISRRVWDSWSAYRRRAIDYAPLSNYGFAAARAI